MKCEREVRGKPRGGGTWDTHKHKISSTNVIQLLYEVKDLIHKLRMQRGLVHVQSVRVPNIVDADPKDKHRVVTAPRPAGAKVLQEGRDLGRERCAPGRDDRVVDGRAAGRKVVAERDGGVELGHEVADPIGAAGGGGAWEGGVAQGVVGAGGGATDPEASSGVGVAARGGVSYKYMLIAIERLGVATS